MAEQLNAKRLYAAVDAFNDGGYEDLDQFIADDIVWHVGGNHPLSGIYRGRTAVAEYHQRAAALCDGPLQIEPTEVIAGKNNVAVFLRVHGQRAGRTLDVGMAEMITLDQEGRWLEFRALSDEQDQIDAFWSAALVDLRPSDATSV